MKEVGLKAEGGDGTAMWQLGLWYDFGRQGLPIDAVQSRAWYERSAAARDPKGMAAFGDALLCGWGGPQNTALGLVMASQAAELGSDLGAYRPGLFQRPMGPGKGFCPSTVLVEENCRWRVRAQEPEGSRSKQIVPVAPGAGRSIEIW